MGKGSEQSQGSRRYLGERWVLGQVSAIKSPWGHPQKAGSLEKALGKGGFWNRKYLETPEGNLSINCLPPFSKPGFHEEQPVPQ